MHSKNIILAAGVLSLASAAEIDRDDIPAPCQQVCYPLVSLAAQCDRDNNNDRAELDCICNAAGTREQLPICDACVRQYDSDTDDDDDDDDDDNDVSDLRRDCNLPRQALPYTGPTGSASLAPLASSTRATAATASTSVSTTITSGGTTRTTVVIAGATQNVQGSGGNTIATLTATPIGQENAAATGAGKPLVGAAAAGLLAAVAALA